MQKKKIIFISYNYFPPTFSGKLVVSGRRLQDIDPEKFEVAILTRNVRGLPKEDDQGHLKVYRSPSFGEGKIGKRLNAILFWLWSSWKLKKEENVDIVHFDEPAVTSFPFMGSWGYEYGWKRFAKLAELAQKKGANTIFEHAISDKDGDFAPEACRIPFYEKVDKIVCISDALYEAAHAVYPAKATKIVYGIEDDVFLPLEENERVLIRRENGENPDALIFSFVGLVVRRKGFDLICKAFNRLAAELPDIRLWVLGPCSHAESKHIHDDEVAGYKLDFGENLDKVRFFGNTSDRNKLARNLAATDVCLFPTRQEGFGLAPVEAMSCGVPSIITRIPGITDLANVHGVTGFYIDLENEEQLFEAMKKLAVDRDLRKSMGKQARERIEEKFTWKQHLKKWEDFYSSNG